eukprot:m.207821 g.207821  ORF g.207821 m.207821 type:complete len:136 (-) comp32994_c2_seq9:1783-2190(-)
MLLDSGQLEFPFGTGSVTNDEDDDDDEDVEEDDTVGDQTPVSTSPLRTFCSRATVTVALISEGASTVMLAESDMKPESRRNQARRAVSSPTGGGGGVGDGGGGGGPGGEGSRVQGGGFVSHDLCSPITVPEQHCL